MLIFARANDVYGTLRSRDAGQQQRATAPGQAGDRKGKQPILYNVFIVLMTRYNNLPNCRLT